jgi:Flp pilus assembly pilin Flp
LADEKDAATKIDNHRPSGHYYVHKSAWEFILGSPGGSMVEFLRNVWNDEQGQDIAEYAVMLAVILVLVIGTVRLIGGSANNVFSGVANNMQQ